MIYTSEPCVITWDEIKWVWDNLLWKGRDSKPVNCWHWGIDNPDTLAVNKWQEQSKPVFLGVRSGNNKLVGVNSIYQSSEDGVYFRSRGLYVTPRYRNQGVANKLLAESVKLAEGAKYVWTVPRKTAVSAYKAAGFVVHGKEFDSTYGANCIASYDKVNLRFY
jgi:GNAT superfamily N-acetyltransferase